MRVTLRPLVCRPAASRPDEGVAHYGWRQQAVLVVLEIKGR